MRIHKALRAPPPMTATSDGRLPVSARSSWQSASVRVTPSITAWIRSMRVVAGVMPKNTPLA